MSKIVWQHPESKWPGRLALRPAEQPFPNIPVPTENPLLALARQAVFRDERTAAAMVRRYWNRPAPREREELERQVEDRQDELQRRAKRLGLRPIRLLQAELVMAATVEVRRRPPPWPGVPEQQYDVWVWQDAVKDARRLLVGQDVDTNAMPLDAAPPGALKDRAGERA